MSSESKEGLENREIEESAKYRVLERLERALLSAILAECILKLSFFRGRHLRLEAAFDLRSLKERAYEVYRPPYQPMTMKEVNLKEYKLAWDLSNIQRAMVIVRDELLETGSYGGLSELSDHLTELKLEENNCLNLLRNPKDIENRRLIFQEEEEEQKYEEFKLERKRLADLYELTAYRIESYKGYIRNYQRSRVEGNRWRVFLNERENKRRLFHISTETEDECTAHSQTVEYLKAAVTKLEEKLEYWKAERIKDILWRNAEIKELVDEQQSHALKRHQLMLDYARRQEEIERYLDEVRERQHLEEMEAERVRSAVRIQAWWRGTMVRCQLGPFCPDHLKKKKKKKEPKKK